MSIFIVYLKHKNFTILKLTKMINLIFTQIYFEKYYSIFYYSLNSLVRRTHLDINDIKAFFPSVIYQQSYLLTSQHRLYITYKYEK